VLSQQILGAAALQRLEIAEHEATVRNTSELVYAAGGVQAAQASSIPGVREAALSYGAAASQLNRHRRFQAQSGVTAAPTKFGKRERAERNERKTHKARKTLQARRDAHLAQETERRVAAGAKVYYTPGADRRGNPTFGKARPENPIEQEENPDGQQGEPTEQETNPDTSVVTKGLPALKLGDQNKTYQEEQRALAAKERAKRGKGGEGPQGIPLDTCERGKRVQRDQRFKRG
jgi:hypothetical protein